jgi:hypothetical protein
MSGVPKNKIRTDEDDSKEDESSSWSEDQRRREYYYDDSHGYEVYDPDKDGEKEPDPKAEPER